jgi:uncharacterized membrane protein
MEIYKLKRLALAGMFLCMGLVLPFFTGQIKEIGDTLLPMHLPIMLCAFICGPRYGFFVGLILPFLRSLTVGMPPIYPNAVWMALELATYGLVIGILYAIGKRHSKLYTLFCLGCAMIAGRVVWGVSKALLLIGRSTFTMKAFVLGGFVDALPGIVLQLILIPLIIDAYERIKQK